MDAMMVDLNLRRPIDNGQSTSEIRMDGSGVNGNEGPIANKAGQQSNSIDPSAVTRLPPLASSSPSALADDGLQNLELEAIGPSPNEKFESLLDDIVKPKQPAQQETAGLYQPDYYHTGYGKVDPESVQVLPRHREVMRRIIEGCTQIEIAADMGVSPTTIGLITKSAIFKSELAILESQLNYNVLRRAEDVANEAFDKLKRLMRSARSESLQATCAVSLLGIGGYSKIEKKQIAVVNGEDVIRELNRRNREAIELSSNGDSRTRTSSVESPGAEE